MTTVIVIALLGLLYVLYRLLSPRSAPRRRRHRISDRAADSNAAWAGSDASSSPSPFSSSDDTGCDSSGGDSGGSSDCGGGGSD